MIVLLKMRTASEILDKNCLKVVGYLFSNMWSIIRGRAGDMRKGEGLNFSMGAKKGGEIRQKGGHNCPPPRGKPFFTLHFESLTREFLS